MLIGGPLIIVLPLLLLIVMTTCDSGAGDETVIAGVVFTTPFKEGVPITITSKFGTRIDPINHTSDFHSGVDLDAPDGSEVVSIGDGEVVKVVLNNGTLGNSVYVKHNVDNVVYYSVYGHLLNNSIVVSEGQQVKAKQKLAIIGNSGRVTGIHLHLTLMTPELKWNQKNLIDPVNIITGLK